MVRIILQKIFCLNNILKKTVFFTSSSKQTLINLFTKAIYIKKKITNYV